MDKPVPGKNPGLFFVHSKVKKPEELSDEVFNRWYSERHIPDVLKTSGIKQASRWQALDPNGEWPYLALYPLEDTDFLETKEFSSLPLHDDSIPGSHFVFDYVSFETRPYSFVQLYEAENASKEQPDFVIAAGFTPADEHEYDSWYRQEHLNDISKVPGWVRTARYVLNSPAAQDGQPAAVPKFLTLHFLNGSTLPEQDLAKAGESELSKKMMSTMKKTQVEVFKKIGLYRA